MSAFLSLTEQQKKALFAALSRKDVFTILSTGHGKCIIFQLLPAVCKYLSLRGYSYPRHAIILVVCPLKSVVDSHICKLRNRWQCLWKILVIIPKNVDFSSATYFYINSANPVAVVWNNVGFFKWCSYSWTLVAHCRLLSPKWRWFVHNIISPGLAPLKKIAADKHVFAKWLLVTLFISNLTRLTAVVCMKVRFEAKVTRGFSLSPRRFRNSLSPLRGLLLISFANKNQEKPLGPG